jgi:hypothetical protein
MRPKRNIKGWTTYLVMSDIEVEVVAQVWELRSGAANAGAGSLVKKRRKTVLGDIPICHVNPATTSANPTVIIFSWVVGQKRRKNDEGTGVIPSMLRLWVAA